MKIKFSEKTIAALVLPPGKAQLKVWDTGQKGFGVILGPLGASFISNVRRADKKWRLETLGKVGKLSLTEARKLAKATVGQVADGKDTAGDKRRWLTTGPSFRAAVEIKIEAMIKNGKEADSIASVRKELLNGKHLADWLDRLLWSLTPWEVSERHLKIGQTSKHAANRIMRNVSSTWNVVAKHAAKLQKACPANPVGFVEFFKPGPGFVLRRKEPMPWSALPGWRIKVDALPNRYHRLFYYTLLFTGLRKGDTFTIRWEHLNLTPEMIEIKVWNRNKLTYDTVELEPFSVYRPSPKGGPQKAFYIPLPKLLVDMFLQHQAARDGDKDNGFVFPGKKHRGKDCAPCANLGLPPHTKGLVTHMFNTLDKGILPSPHRHRDTYLSATKKLDPPMPHSIAKRLVNHADADVTEGYMRYDYETLSYWQEKQCAFLLSRMRHLQSVPLTAASQETP